MRRLVPLALFFGALAVRALFWREVVGSGEVLPVDPDSWYHLRRIAYSLHAFPAVLDFDPYLNFPAGAKPIWTPVFDWCAALLLRPFVGPLDAGGYDRLARWGMWLPPLLGAGTVVWTWAVARRHFGALAAAVAGVALCLVSGHFWYTQIGFLDHHAALGLAFVGLLAAQLAWLAHEQAGSSAGAWRAALGGGVAIAATFAVWPGGLLHVALFELCAWAFVLTSADAARAQRRALRRAASFGLATALLAPLCLGNTWPQWGRASPVVLSDFQPWLLGSATAVWLACAGLWRARGASRGGRALQFAAAVAAVAALGLALLPDLRAGLADAWRWLAKAESFQAQVAESKPLLFDERGLSFDIAAIRLSLFGLAYPLAAAWLGWRVRRRDERARVWTLLGVGAGLFAATLLQRRFFDVGTIPIALALGLAARELHAWLSRRGTARAAPWAVAVFVMLVLAPSLLAYVRPLLNELKAWRGENLWVTGAFGFDRAGSSWRCICARRLPSPPAGSIPRSRPSTACWHPGTSDT